MKNEKDMIKSYFMVLVGLLGLGFIFCRIVRYAVELDYGFAEAISYGFVGLLIGIIGVPVVAFVNGLILATALWLFVVTLSPQGD